MANPAWDEYGGDPVPGDPGNVDSLLAVLAQRERSGQTLIRLSSSMGDTGDWTGAAADQGRALISKLIPELSRYWEAHLNARDVLTQYVGGYRDRFMRARALYPEIHFLDERRKELENRYSQQQSTMFQTRATAGVAKARLLSTQKMSSLAGTPPASDPTVIQADQDHQRAQAAADSASRSLNDTHAQLSQVLSDLKDKRRQADQLRDEQRDAANATARRIHEVMGAGIDLRTVLDNLHDAYTGTMQWLDGHLPLETIDKYLKVAQAVVGIASLLLGWVPVLGEILLAANVVLSIASFATRWVLMANGKASWTDVAWAGVSMAAAVAPFALAKLLKPTQVGGYMSHIGKVKAGPLTRLLNKPTFRIATSKSGPFSLDRTIKILRDTSKVPKLGAMPEVLQNLHLDDVLLVTNGAVQLTKEAYSIRSVFEDGKNLVHDVRTGELEVNVVNVLEWGGDLADAADPVSAVHTAVGGD